VAVGISRCNLSLVSSVVFRSYLARTAADISSSSLVKSSCRPVPYSNSAGPIVFGEEVDFLIVLDDFLCCVCDVLVKRRSSEQYVRCPTRSSAAGKY